MIEINLARPAHGVDFTVTGPTVKPVPHPFYGDYSERGLDPWHADAFRGTPAEGKIPDSGPRQKGWFLIDGAGNAIGFVLDGTPVAETHLGYARAMVVRGGGV